MCIFFKYFLYFIIYSFIGWVIEVIYTFFGDKKFINRGFLIGPICPIYGFGVLLIITLIGKTTDMFAIFLKSIFICSLLEYFTSYIMEKIFHARWWDYSKNKYNINGRICLETMVPFGLLGTLVMKIVHPFIENTVSIMSDKLLLIVSILLLIIFIVDIIISFNVLNKIKNQISDSKSDNTELIRKKVFNWIDNNSVLFKRIKKAFPKFEIYKKVMGKIKK